jgi:hypothetical protein
MVNGWCCRTLAFDTDSKMVVLDRRHPEGRADRIRGERRQPLTSVQQSMWSQFGYFAVETD